MSFCTGCVHFSYAENHVSRVNGQFERSPAYFCSNPAAIRASQKDPDPSVTRILIGRVCWTCRGEFYIWDEETPIPPQITLIRECKRLVKEEEERRRTREEKVPYMKVPTLQDNNGNGGVTRPVKTRKETPMYVKNKVVDPAKKRKSNNQTI
jgi:hypothetical protein